MAGKSRDLSVNIDGNPQGFDKAVLSAKSSAEVFERELAKLERTQKHQEESLKRAEAATKAYGRANSDAAEKAIRFGHAAEQAGEKAAVSQRAAAEAADKLAKGEIKADEAAQAEARALRDVERAAIATAVAQRASAKAAEDQARQEKQAARDAVVAAATQRLEHLKTAGAVKEHNALLTKLKKDYKEFDKGFTEMRTLGQQAFAGLKTAMSSVVGVAGNVAQSLGPGMVAIILAALAVLPAAATLIGGGITLGLGGAFAAIGLMATAGSDTAKHAIDDMKTHIQSVMGQVTKPFEQTWVALGDSAKSAIDGIAPDLSKLFATLAPEVSGFAQQLGHALPGQLHNFFTALQNDFGPVISELGATLPQALGRAADGIAQIMNEIAAHPQEFGNLINGTGRLVQALGTVMVWLIKVGEAFTWLNSKTGELGAAFQNAGNKLGFFGKPLRDLGGFISRFDLSTQNAGNTLVSFGGNLATAAAQAGLAATATGKLAQQTNELDRAIQKILDPSLALSNDTIAMKEGQVALAAALKASHGQMGLQTAASRAASSAFNSQIKLVATMATDQKNLDGNTKRATATVQSQIDRLWKLAGSNKDAQAQVIRLAQAFGVTLPNSAQKAKGKVDGVHSAINGLKSKSVNLNVNTSAAEAAIQRLRDMAGQPLPPAHFSHGGYVAGYASGGLAGFPGGGQVFGAGSTTSDSIMARLSNREFVVNAKQTAEWLPELVAINNGMLSKATASGHAEHASMVALPSAHNAMTPIGISRIMRPVGAASSGALSGIMSRVGAGAASAGGGSTRVDIYFHEPHGGGVMAQIVKNLKVDVRTLGGGSAQVFFGSN
jgi:hypothetical protein